MCHQSVGLVQSIIEKSGIPTVSITLLREVTERVGPPRALFVDRPLGYPLGEAGNAPLQKRTILAALHLVVQAISKPVISNLEEAGTADSGFAGQ
jgi:D-proline reductase (dithiol) PrdB